MTHDIRGEHFTDAQLDTMYEVSKRDAHFVGSEIRQLIGDIRSARGAEARLRNQLGIVLSALRMHEEATGESFDDEGGDVANIEIEHNAQHPHASDCDKQGERLREQTSISWQQDRGVAWDIIDQAIADYDEWMLDDDYDAMPKLHEIIKRMRERKALYQEASTHPHASDCDKQGKSTLVDQISAEEFLRDASGDNVNCGSPGPSDRTADVATSAKIAQVDRPADVTWGELHAFILKHSDEWEDEGVAASALLDAFTVGRR
jgi:hypothetical protein